MRERGRGAREAVSDCIALTRHPKPLVPNMTETDNDKSTRKNWPNSEPTAGAKRYPYKALTLRARALRVPHPPLLRHASKGRGRHRAPDHAGERDDRQGVGNHLDELRWNELGALELNLERLRRGKQ